MTGLVIVGLCVVAAAASLVCARDAWVTGLAAVPEFDSFAAGVQTFSQLGCALVTLYWLSSGLGQVRDAGAEGLSVGPLGGVLWWFVPLANLVMPAKAVAELRKAAIHPRNWEAVAGAWWIWLWWAFWLAAGVANAVFWRASSSDDSELLGIAGSASFVGNVLSVPAALLFAVVVWSIDPHLGDLKRSPSTDLRPAERL
jgi:hypothetical protein